MFDQFFRVSTHESYLHLFSASEYYTIQHSLSVCSGNYHHPRFEFIIQIMVHNEKDIHGHREGVRNYSVYICEYIRLTVTDFFFVPHVKWK